MKIVLITLRKYFLHWRVQQPAFIILCFIIILFGFVIKDHKILRLQELKTLDYRFQLRGKTDIHKDIILISIGEKDIELLGRWPWPRKYHADLVQVLSSYGARVIGFDILFGKPDKENPESDQWFADALKNAGNIVLPMAFGHGTDHILPVDAFMQSCSRCGFVNLSADEDGLVRRMAIQREGRQPLGLAIACQGLSMKSTKLYPGRSLTIYRANGTKTDIPLDSSDRMYINYAGRTNDWTWLHFTQIIMAFIESREGKTPSIDLDRLRDKIILIGSTHTGMSDIIETPFGTSGYGIELHASIINSILNNKFLRPVPSWVNVLVYFLLSALAGFFLMKYKPLKGGLIILSVTVCYLVLTYLLFSRFFLIIALTGPVLGVSLVYVSGSVFYFVTIERKEREVKRAFGCYVSPEVVAELVKNPDKLKLGGETTDMTIMFSDIRKFTALSEQISADELGEFLNDYFTLMISCIFQCKGTLDKFIGDAIMAFFGAPLPLENHPANACSSAIMMMTALGEMNKKRARQGKSPVQIGIGLNSGMAKVGNFGSADHFNYTVVGESVNLASRLEGLTKTYNAPIIISLHTYQRVCSEMLCRPLDRVIVKGSEKPLEIYELIGRKGEVTGEKFELVESFQKGLEFFWGGNWQEAEKIFNDLVEKFPDDGPARVFAQRVRQYRKTLPPGDWGGVFRQTTK